MDQQPIPNARQPWQFSLGQLLLAVVFVALACAVGKYFLVSVAVDTLDPMSRGVQFAPIPIFLCGAIGVLCGRLKYWLTGVSLWRVLVAVVALALPISQLECFSADPRYGLIPQETRLEWITIAEIVVAFVWYCGKKVWTTWRDSSKHS